jgi:protein-disulfide isomerase
MGDRVEITFKHFPLQALEPSVQAAEAAEAAGAQGKFWPYHDLLFKNQNQVSRDDFLRFAKELKLDLKRFTKELDEHTYRAKVMADRDEGMKAGLQGTPGLFINGHELKLDHTVDNFRDRAEYELENDCR